MEQLVQVGAMLLRRWRVGSTRSVASGVFSPLGNDNHAAHQPNPWALFEKASQAVEKANEERRQAVEKANEERRQADEKALETMTLLAAANEKLAAETRERMVSYVSTYRSGLDILRSVLTTLLTDCDMSTSP